MDGSPRDRYLPLSLSQRNIFNLEKAFSGTSINNISTTVRIRGSVDFVLLQKSINLIIEKDSSLRLRLVNVDGETLQYSAPYIREEFPVYDFTNTSSEGIENWEAAVTKELIPLEDGPLYRFILFRDSENSGGILVKLHHIIADGWSQIMVCNKIGKTYLELLSGEGVSLEESPDYQLHIQEELDYLSSKAYGRDEKYWKSIVERIGEPSSLKNIYSAFVSPVGRRMSFELPQVINHAVFSFCQEKRVSPFAVFYMALAIYFKRNGGADRFTIGVPIFNRTTSDFKQSTGMFVTTLPFFNEIRDEWTLNTFNEDLFEKWYELLRHQRYPFSDICKLSGSDGRLFNIALSYQDSKIYESREASVHLSGRWHYCGYQAEQLTIHVTNLKDHQQYAVDYDYLAQYFTEQEITALHNNLCHILYEALNEPDKPIHSLNVLSLEEKEQVLYTFNKTDKYLEDVSVYDLFLRKSRKYLNRAAIIHNGERMTYGTLLHKGAQYACAISEKVKGHNELAAIMLPRDFNLPAAMIGVLQQECAYLLLSKSLPAERIRKILNQSEAAVLITDTNGKKLVGELSIPILTTDEVESSYGIPAYKNGCDCNDHSDLLAYAVYTSGSTGEPKGVKITQKNLLNLAQEMEPVYGSGAVLSVCNVGFDAFMLESIVALLNGRTIVFPTDGDLESPERLAELMNSYAVDFFAMTPSRLSVLLGNKTFKRVMYRMESIVCGGEHFPPELLKKLKLCTNARIYNQYGPSEASVVVSMKELSRADKITVGSPLGNCKMYVLDQWLNPLPVGGKGRLFIGGKCVGGGYLNNPDITEKVFRSNPFINDDRIYDTGDIAHWTSNGEIVLIGRVDSQVKLRGLRIELQEISSCAESFPGIISAFAKICNVNGSELLGVYYTSDTAIREADIIAHMATYLPEYMIPSFFIHVPSLPITANGKVDESSLPVPKFIIGDDCGAVSPDAEKILDIFRNVLNNSSIGVSGDFFRNGGNSLNAMQCVMEIEEQLSKKIRIADLYAYRTAARLASYIYGGDISSAVASAENRPSGLSLVKKNKKNEYPLSGIQQGIYIQSMLDSSGLVYNMPGAFKLEKKPDFERLENAFSALVKQDAIFRTVFVQSENGVSARILDNVSFKLEFIEGEDFESASMNFLRPFDLSKAPLLRAGMWTSPDGEWFLFIDCHHIIGDGLSTPIILQRLDSFYCNGAVNAEWDFYDYLNSVSDRAADDKMIESWRSHLEGLPERLDLCGDHTRPNTFDYKGKEYEVLFEEKESRAFEAYCKAKGLSEFSVFLAAYGMLLSAVSGKNDLIIGTPVSGRDIVGSADICGPFIKTLPVRLKVKNDITVDEWLGSVCDEILFVLDNQNISLEEIINALGLPHGAQNALYQVMLTQSPVDTAEFRLSDSKMEFAPISTGRVKMDMILDIRKSGDRHSLVFSYATSLFEEETVAFYGRCIKNLIGEFIEYGEAKLSDIRIMSDADRYVLIDTPNYNVSPFINCPIHKMLNNIASINKNETAIIFHDEKTSFAQLEARANHIADFIVSKGIKEGSCVALCMKRTPDMIAAMYGILKAGCSYMFLLDSFPEARIKYMLDVSAAVLIICDEFVELPKKYTAEKLAADICLLPEFKQTKEYNFNVKDNSLVNVLFTSGSTGQPKGVMLRHRSVSNLYSQMKKMLSSAEGKVLCSTNAVFDCFIVETLIALALGRTVVLADEEEMMLPWKLAALIEKYETSVFEMTPTRLNMCLGNEAFRQAAKYIKIVLLGGEVVTDRLVNKFYDCSDGVLMNMYGPTEATVFTTAEPLKRGEHITVGAPLQNTRVYVLDENRKPVLPTACGELYISGECLSLGYVGRDDITEASFVDDIYFPGEKMYRSGDIARLRIDGRYDYIGRKDSQVKLNGQRVELDEINGAIEKLAENIQAATVAVTKENGSMELFAYYVTEDNSLTESKVLSEIKKYLPEYMIPSVIVRLERMPLTATNKKDLVLLKNYAFDKDSLKDLLFVQNCNVAETSDTESVEESLSADIPNENNTPTVGGSVTDINVEYVLSVWNSVLSIPVTSADSEFFSSGGTSMLALTVLGRYYNDKLEMSLSDFYNNPTARQQAELLRSAYCVEELPKELPSEDLPEELPSEEPLTNELLENCGKAVFVSGATGFFGAHLVKELIDNGTSDIICLIRNGKSERLAEILSLYFGEESCTSMMARINVVSGDISEPQFGMSDEDYSILVSRVSEIYHCAADVRHYAADIDSYMATNVGGTENMIALAKLSGAYLYHISTCSVSGYSLKSSGKKIDFTENDFDIGQVWEKNIYVKSKFLAEKAVFEAMKTGVKAKIFRLGRLVGRDSDGKFQKNPETNAFYLTLKGFKAVNALPTGVENKKLDLMPIDRSAKQVMMLRNGENSVYHIINPEPPTLGEILRAVSPSIRSVSIEEFYGILHSGAAELDGALFGLVIDTVRSNSLESYIQVTNTVTTEDLKKLGYVAEAVDIETVLKDF